MGPLLGGRYILTLDMVFGPDAPSPDGLLYGFQAPVLGARLVPQLAIAGLGSIVPMWVVQKAILVAIFTLAGLGGHYLRPSAREYSRYYSGLLYLVNPFVYARFLAGHWYILLAYAVAPFAIRAFIDLLERPGKGTWTRSLLLASVVAISSHILALTLAVWAVVGLFHIIGRRLPARTYVVLALLPVGFFLLNAYWIVPALSAEETVLEAITDRDLRAFAPTAALVSPWVSVAVMYGFWREGYQYPVSMFPWLLALFGVFLWLSVLGTLNAYRSRLALAVVCVGLAGFVLGSGVSGPFARVFEFLAHNVPFFVGFRDSQKFVVFLVIAYPYLGAIGLETLVAELRRRDSPLRLWTARTVLALALLSPCAYTFTMFWGFHGYVRPVDYPEDWYAVREFLAADREDASVLVLPWESYLEYSWVPNADRNVRSLAPAFFGAHLVHAKGIIRRPGIYSQSFAPEQDYVESLLDDAWSRLDFGARLRSLGAKYVVLVKEGLQKGMEFAFLYGQNDLQVVLDTPTIALFRNRLPVSRLYVADTPDLPDGNTAAARAVRLSPVRYQLTGDPGYRYMLFSPPNLDMKYWRLEGQGLDHSPSRMMGIFEAGTGVVATYRPFYANLAWYAVSGAALAATLALAGWGAVPGRAARTFRRPFQRAISRE